MDRSSIEPAAYMSSFTRTLALLDLQSARSPSKKLHSLDDITESLDFS